MNVTKYFYLLLILTLGFAQESKAQQYLPVDVGSHTQMDTSLTYTYGYWFVAQSCFRITGVRVPSEVDSVENVIQIVMFDTIPPNGPSGTNEFENLEYIDNILDTNIVQTDLVISTGDIVGVLGGGTNESMIHSMHMGNHSATINGASVDFNRLVYDGQLNSGQAFAGLYTEDNALGYSRVELYYDTDIEIEADFTFNVDFADVNFYDESNGGDTYFWTFGDGGSSQDQDPTHSYSSVGTYEVSLVVTDVCGMDSHTDTVEILTLDVEEMQSEKHFSIQPNPTNGRALVTTNLSSNKELKVYDVSGKLLLYKELLREEEAIDLRNYTPGVYFVQVGTETQRLVVSDNK